MKALVLALALASMVALPGAAISHTNQELLREIHGLREDLRSRLLDQELSQDMRDLRQQQRDDARERKGQERHQRELERRIRGGLGPFPCCEPH
jgi:hypothetical protein